MDTRTYRAGQTVDDVCRACKADRLHTIIVVDEHGRPLRVACGYCGSEHNFRGGPQRDVVPRDAPPDRSRQRAALRPSSDRPPFPLVAESELVGGDVSMDDLQGRDLELLLRRIIRQETGLTPAVPAEKWRGGTLVLKAGNDTQDKSWPIETFFHKVVMIRNRLRTLEQQLNALDVPEDTKVKLQAYISGCYGSLTSFNVLFADEDDQVRGSGGD